MLPCKQGAWGCRKSWKGAQRGQLTSADHRDVPYHTAPCSACEGAGKKEEGHVCNYSLRIPKQPLHMVKLSLTENGWISAFPQEAESEPLILLSLCIQLLLYPMNCLYLIPRVFSRVWHSSDSPIVIAEFLAQVSNQRNQRWIIPVNCYHVVHFCSHCQCRAFFLM